MRVHRLGQVVLDGLQREDAVFSDGRLAALAVTGLNALIARYRPGAVGRDRQIPDASTVDSEGGLVKASATAVKEGSTYLESVVMSLWRNLRDLYTISPQSRLDCSASTPTARAARTWTTP